MGAISCRHKVGLSLLLETSDGNTFAKRYLIIIINFTLRLVKLNYEEIDHDDNSGDSKAFALVHLLVGIVMKHVTSACPRWGGLACRAAGLHE